MRIVKSIALAGKDLPTRTDDQWEQVGSHQIHLKSSFVNMKRSSLPGQRLSRSFGSSKNSKNEEM